MKTLFLFFLLVAGMLQGNAQELYASAEREAEKPMARNVAVTSYAWEFYSAFRDYSAHSYAKSDPQVFGKDICGHIHNFQHIRRKDSPVDYIVNSSASLSRKAEPTEGTLFCSGATGFSVCSASAKDLRFYMLDKEGKVLYTVEREK